MTIQALIDKQDSFEIVRDKIGLILASESASQQALATAAAKDPDLWRNLALNSQKFSQEFSRLKIVESFEKKWKNEI